MVSRGQLRTAFAPFASPVRCFPKLPIRISVTAMLHHSRKFDISLQKILQNYVAVFFFLQVFAKVAVIRILCQSKTGLNFKQYDFYSPPATLKLCTSIIISSLVIQSHLTSVIHLKYVPVILGHLIRTLRSRLDIILFTRTSLVLPNSLVVVRLDMSFFFLINCI